MACGGIHRGFIGGTPRRDSYEGFKVCDAVEVDLHRRGQPGFIRFKGGSHMIHGRPKKAIPSKEICIAAVWGEGFIGFIGLIGGPAAASDDNNQPLAAAWAVRSPPQASRAAQATGDHQGASS